MSQPMDPMATESQDPCWQNMSQEPMEIDEVAEKKLRAHVIMSHGIAVEKSKSTQTPVTTINLRASYPNVIVVMNCKPIPQKLPCNLATLWANLNTFNGDMQTIANLMINLNDIYFPMHQQTGQAGLCYFFDRCPNIYLNPERERWRDGIFELPQQQFTATETYTPNFRCPVQKEINNMSCFKDLASYIDYLHVRDRTNLHIVIVFACTNPVEDSKAGETSYDNPKLKYCRSFPVNDTRSCEVLSAIYTKWASIKAGGGNGSAPQTLFLLGRNRKIHKKNNKLYIRYNNELITLKRAITLEERQRLKAQKV